MHLEVKISLIKRSWQVQTALLCLFVWVLPPHPLILVCFNQVLSLQKLLWVLINYILMSYCSLLCDEDYCSWKSCTESFSDRYALNKLLTTNIQGARTWPLRTLST